MLHCMALMSEAVKIVCFFSFDDNVVSLIGFPEEVANVMVRGDEGSATSAAAVDSQVPTSRRSDEVNFSLAHGLPVAAIASRLLSRVLLLHSWGFPRPIFEKQVEHVLIAIVRTSGTAVVLGGRPAFFFWGMAAAPVAALIADGTAVATSQTKQQQFLFLVGIFDTIFV